MALRGWVPAALLALTTSACATTPRVVFDTEGGDAWTFDLQISGRVIDGTCDAVVLQSPAGTANALQLADRFSASVPLLAGENQVRAQCRQRDRIVAQTAPQTWRGALPDTPKAWIRIVIANEAVRLDAGASELAPATPAPIVRQEWFLHGVPPEPLLVKNDRPLSNDIAVVSGDIEIRTPRADGEYYVRLRATDALGRSDESIAVFRVVAAKAQYVDLESEHPSWVDRAIVYGATPYVFEPQSFEGIRERLDEIAALGATVVWLSPVTAAADDDFGYAVTNHFSLRERFGTAASFRKLVESAHRLGLRVIVDFVPNHVSERHAYHRDTLARTQRSPYYGWFDRNEEGEITQYFDWSHLKNLDYDNREVQNYVIDAFSRFVREFKVDGFRVDASWAVAARAPEFWPRLRTELKRIDPDVLLLAEASARDPYHVANGFDAAYDWTSQLGQWAWHDVFVEGTAHLDRLRAALMNEGHGFPPDSLILRFLNNNDTGERFASRHGEDTARLAATLLFTLPGLPLIYNGDEIAAQFEPYDEGPPLTWNDAHPLVAHYRKLAELRQQVAALRSRDLEVLTTTEQSAVLAYLRPAKEGDVLVLLNFSDRQIRVKGGDPRSKAVLKRFSNAYDLLGDARVKRGPFLVGAKGALVLANR